MSRDITQNNAEDISRVKYHGRQHISTCGLSRHQWQPKYTTMLYQAKRSNQWNKKVVYYFHQSAYYLLGFDNMTNRNTKTFIIVHTKYIT